MRMGASSFRKLGTPQSAGTKIFSLSGQVENTGLIEVPFGTTLREIVDEIGGGVKTDDGLVQASKLKAVQVGGPVGTCLTAKHLDLRMDFEALDSIHAQLGTGGLVVMNDRTCIVSMAHFFMQFGQNESCGQCELCQEGSLRIVQLLQDIVQGRATGETLQELEALAQAIPKGSKCKTGRSASNPVLATLKHFRGEYEAHVFDKRCPSRRCKALCVLSIAEHRCTGCMQCRRRCPAGAISGERGRPHRIDASKCTRCGTCIDSCNVQAIDGA
jgi:NADH-quinone oxidoreductase subunit F